jgi:hypothetical protein
MPIKKRTSCLAVAFSRRAASWWQGLMGEAAPATDFKKFGVKK